MFEQRSVRDRIWLAPRPLESSSIDRPGLTPLPPWLGALIARRGVNDDSALARYLEPSLGHLDDPSAIADMKHACHCVFSAINRSCPITVYGDYDVDGVCATALLVEFLRELGARVDYYIPHRCNEGYGLNEAAIREIAETGGLLITVDCGVQAHESVALARSLAVDVVIVDHHQVPDSLPEANACLNPQRADCLYPFKGLCATGVAFLLAVALRREMREQGAFVDSSEPDVRPLLDLVALATVADMVPMIGTNRTLVAAGLKTLRRAPRPGLRALIEQSRIDTQSINARDLGFRLAPRVNAVGRLHHASEAVELMLTPDHARARHLAALLEQANQERRALEKSVENEAMAQAESAKESPALVVAEPSWHPGILGLIASRLVSRFHRPALVIGTGGTGSGRSIPGLDICRALSKCATHLERFGGHRAAAGLTLRDGALDGLRQDFQNAVIEQLGEPPYVASVQPDLELRADELSMGLVDELNRLEPFGQENPEPLFLARNLRVRQKRVVGGDHLKLSLGEEAHDAIAFGLGRHVDAVPDQIDVVFRVERNVFRGRESLQLRVDDFREAQNKQDAQHRRLGSSSPTPYR